MTKAKTGDSIKVHYTGTFDDGTLFETSVGGAAIEFTLGSGEVIPGFEKGVEGMAVGDKRSIRIPAAEAYGEYYPEYVQEFDRNQITTDRELEVGMEIKATTPEGHTFAVFVTAINGDRITIDGNHPMAGKDLNFELELVDIVSSSQ